MEKDFFLQGMPVGIFRVEEWPVVDGDYLYEAYRGPGHLDMITRLRRGETPMCYYITDEWRCEFIVLEAMGSGKPLRLKVQSIIRIDGDPNRP